MLSQKEIDKKIKEVLVSGQWMIRRSNNGVSCSEDAHGFKWSEIGEWTEVFDWEPTTKCGNGLHGNGPKSDGYWTNGKNVDFCCVEDIVYIDRKKIKCRKAMILLRDELPEGLHVGGTLKGINND